MSDIIVNSEDAVCYSSCRIAASRAIETERGVDALVKDPLASILASSALEERRMKYAGKTTDSTWRIAIRTKYFDDYIESQRNVVEQVVLLGAGMDTRAHRLLLESNVTFYELDQQQVLDWKTQLLNSALHKSDDHDEDVVLLKQMIRFGNDRTRRIACNLESSDGSGWKQNLLSNSDFEPQKSTLWVLEGLTYYLSNDVVVSNLFQTMRHLSSTTSSCIVSVATTISVKRASSSSTDALMQSWKWGHDNPTEFLFQNGGWICQDVVTLGDESRANYGRYPKTNNGTLSGIKYVTATLQ